MLIVHGRWWTAFKGNAILFGLLIVAGIAAQGDAKAFYNRALDREAVLDDSGAIVWLRRAIAADPSYFPPHYEISRIYTQRGRYLELRRLYDDLPSNATIDCMRAFTRAPVAYRVHSLQRISALEKDHAASDCSLFMRAQLAPMVRARHVGVAKQLVYTNRVARAMPDFAPAIALHAMTLATAGRHAEADALLRKASVRGHVLERLEILSAQRRNAAERGDVAAADNFKRALLALAARDGRAGVLFVAQDPWRETGQARSSALLKQVAIAHDHRAYAKEISPLINLGSAAIDEGNNASALDYLNRAASLAQQFGGPGLRMLTYRLRGRALSKTGDTERARQDLETAISLHPQVRDEYELAEVYHNLAHVYEGQGRLREAASAVDRFVALARPFMHAQPRMMSLHDAAEIRWKAGWHAAAQAALAEMVKVVDAQESNHYWAGEYFERAGEYSKARKYYEAGVKSGEETSLNYAGLMRVYEALDVPDSAAAAAAEHDRIMTDQFDVPLRPQVLMRLGRSDEAIRIAQEWIGLKVAQKHVQGEARARNQLADLYLSAGRPDAALAEAQRAAAQAQRLNLAPEIATATRLIGTALSRGRNAASAVPILKRAIHLGDGVSSIEERRVARMALGDALAAAGDTTAALAQYRRAASNTDTVSSSLVDDVARARLRSSHHAAFDRAMTLLLANPEKQISNLVSWSQLRKASALSFGVIAPRVRARAEVQSRIAADEVVIDYIVVDQTIGALVLTRTAAHAVVLPTTEPEVRRLIERVRSPLLRVYAGRIDLARASFDVDAAHQLFERILEPLLTFAPNARTITIAPDGSLHGVVFDALVTAPGRGYLIDRYALRQIPSLALLSPSARVPSGSRVLMVSGETPGAARELAGVRASLRGARIVVLERGRATENAVQRSRSAFDVVHVATHGRADERDPMGSYLALARDTNSDGFLHVSEIAARPAQNTLVVLSACQTLDGPVFAGEGVMSVSRAFLTSGARSVVATTWPIGAATADLMTTFYRDLHAGQPVTDALRAAKLELRRGRATAHPFYWASFVLVTR